MEERESLGTEEMIEEINTLIKKMLNLKVTNIKHPRILGNYEKTKSKNNRDRGRRRNPG